jgi:hydrophobe/amphiphile efflux-3 (HAE3) family protein
MKPVETAKVSRPLHTAASLAARRPGLVLVLVVMLALAGLASAMRLQPDAGVDTLVGTDSPAYAATQTLREQFGDDAIIVLVRGDLRRLLLSQDLERLLALEGCLAGAVPATARPPGGPRGPCAQLGRDAFAKVVLGPGTFVNTAVRELRAGYERSVRRARQRADDADAAARRRARSEGLGTAAAARRGAQARRDAEARFTSELLTLATRYGLTSVPQLDDPAFVSTLVFDATKPPGTPKRRFAYLFPTDPARPGERGRTALVQVRLNAGLSAAQRAQAIALVRAAVRLPALQPRNGATYTVTGAPVVAADLAGEITSSMRILLIAALLVMASTLALVFRSRLRLLPLAIALAAAALTFGALSLAGSSLTMASIAVLPVLIGLAVDYAIQLQARIAGERGAGAGGADLGVAAAARRAALLGAPAVAVAAAATAAGFAVLAFSPVPMVRGFGILLVAGIAIAFSLALLAGTAALVLAERAAPPPRLARLLRRLERRRPEVGALHGGSLLARDAGARLTSTGRRALAYAIARPVRVLAVGLGIAACGWLLDTQTRVESDIQRLVPQDMPALRDLDALQRSTGVGGELDVIVRGADIASPEVIAWMTRYQSAVLEEHGFSARRGCGQAAVCPAFSLPDLFTTTGSRDDAAAVDALLDAVPPYLSRSVITADRRTATLAFGIRLMPLDEQARVVGAMRARLDDGRPAGVQAALAGLPVLAADANAEVTSSLRRMLTLLAGLAAVAIVLLIAFRELPRALVPLVPIALATGWSALVLFALRVPLNPLSVTLGALVIAISTEFSVLLSERYREERRRGFEPAAALERTYRSTGAAVLASGATAIAGFAVLVVSDISMLRDFGFVTVVDLTVSLLGVLVVLPAVLLLAERAPHGGAR